MSNDQEMWGSSEEVRALQDLQPDLPRSFDHNVVLEQKNRPETMKYFDFVVDDVHAMRFRELLEAKQQGRKVVGSYCTFVPEELILALDAISVGLCSDGNVASGLVDQYLPRNTCALIRSAFGVRLGKESPYLQACDLVAGENTCSGKRRAYEILRPYLPRLYVLDLPKQKNEEGKQFLRDEFRKLVEILEDVTGRKLEAPKLAAAIVTVNEKRKAMMRLAALRGAVPSPISGLDALLISRVAFYDDPIRFTGAVHQVCDELEMRIRRCEGVVPPACPRIALSGCPMAVPGWTIPAIVESCGAVIVAEEGCVGERSRRWLMSETGDTVQEMVSLLAERYLNIDCTVFTPTLTQQECLSKLRGERKADGVIHYSIQACGSCQVETSPLMTALDESSIPTLRIVTTGSPDDAENIRVKVEEFVQRLRV